MSLKVAIDARLLWELGIGTYVRNLLGGLARTGAKGAAIQWTVVVPPGPWRDSWFDPVARAAGFPGACGERAPGGHGGWGPVQVIELAARKQSLGEQIMVPLRLAGLDLDLVHLPHYVGPLLAPAPLVVTVHDLIHLMFPGLVSRLGRRTARFLLGLAVRRARRVIADSHSTARDLERTFPGSRRKLRVIYPGLAARFESSPAAGAVEAYRADRGLPDRYLLAAGAIRPHKNLGLVAGAYAEAALGPGIGLVIAGEAPRRYAGLARELALLGGPGVRLLGRVADQELPLLYGGALAVLVPSLYEGFGLTAVEAMACGAPVVASTGGSLPEVVGEAGLLVPPEDVRGWYAALRRVSHDRGLREELACRGRERARHFGLDRLGRETLAVYREAVAAGG